MRNLFGMTRSDLEEYFLSIGEKKFKSVQVFEWLYQKRVWDIEEFSNIKKEVREQIKYDFDTTIIEIEKKQEDHLTYKYLFKLNKSSTLSSILFLKYCLCSI